MAIFDTNNTPLSLILRPKIKGKITMSSGFITIPTLYLFLDFSFLDYCKANVTGPLDVAELPECCNIADILKNNSGCCKDIFDGTEEACYPKQDTQSVSRSSSRYSTYSIYWCQSKMLKVSDLQTYPICCLEFLGQCVSSATVHTK